MVLERDRLRRQQQRWVMLHIGSVWLLEIADFLLTCWRRRRHSRTGAERGWLSMPRRKHDRADVLESRPVPEPL